MLHAYICDDDVCIVVPNTTVNQMTRVRLGMSQKKTLLLYQCMRFFPREALKLYKSVKYLAKAFKLIY